MLYWIILKVRNFLFDRNILKSSTFNFPLICVGNLAVGGTGKTPMTEYILRVIKDNYRTAVVSRGYKRKTKGYILARPGVTALEIGDEPMQIFSKFDNVRVAVGEERLVAIPQLLHDHPDTQVIVLDDAFQHRSIRPGLNIMLTDYSNLYTRDYLLPVGDLRDVRSSSSRADIIVVTKCKKELSEHEKKQILKEIDSRDGQSVFFTANEYGTPYHLFNLDRKEIHENMDVLLVCALANPTAIKEMLNKNVQSYEMVKFRDHHIFTTDDLHEIKSQFEELGSSTQKIILTTEKDAVRLEKFQKDLENLPIYVLPVRHEILFGEEAVFNKILLDFIESYPR
jgi:tetraacyldisaccharide 4'-kinase